MNMKSTSIIAGLFAVVDVVFVLLALGAFGFGSALTTAGGILGLVAAAMAWYLCLAAVGASTFGRPILPNRPLFRG